MTRRSILTGKLPKFGAASCTLRVTTMRLFRALERLRARWTGVYTAELSLRFSSTKAAPRFRRMDYQVKLLNSLV